MSRIRTLLNRAGCGALVAAALALCAPPAEADFYMQRRVFERYRGDNPVYFLDGGWAQVYRLDDGVGFAETALSCKFTDGSFPYDVHVSLGAMVCYADGAGWVEASVRFNDERIWLEDGPGNGLTLDGKFISNPMAGNESFRMEKVGAINVGSETHEFRTYWVFHLTFDLEGHARGADDVGLSGELHLKAEWGIDLGALGGDCRFSDYDSTLGCSLTTRYSDLAWNRAHYMRAPIEMKATATLTDTSYGVTAETVVTVVDKDIPGRSLIMFDTRPLYQYAAPSILDAPQTDRTLASQVPRFGR